MNLTKIYSRKELQLIERNEEGISDFKVAVNVLGQKVFNDQPISLAEEQFVCGILENLRNEKGVKDINIYDLKSCQNYTFRNRYLLYFNDLNGIKDIVDHEGIISIDRKKIDVAFLKEEYENWFLYLEGKRNGTHLINYVSQEVHQQLKNLKEYCKNSSIGYNHQEYLKKSIVLHGKYIYLLVNEYYQELTYNEEVIELNGEQILIDGFTYVHTMFRHFSEKIKQHQSGKSYHSDVQINFKEVPTFLSQAIHSFKLIQESSSFNKCNLYFIFNERIYAIWLRPFTKHLRGNQIIKYLRVQTFYPLEKKDELNKLKSYNIINANTDFKYLIKNAT